MQLLERGGALGALQEYAAEADRGNGRLVLINGEAGIGKTALLEAFRAALPDAYWAWGNCDPLFTARPLGPLFDVAEQFGGELRRLAREGGSREELVTALVDRLTDDEWFDVIVLEDAHWADESMVVLRQVARHLHDARAMIVISYRDDELRAGEPMRLVLGDLASGPWSRRIGLAPLSAAAVAELVGDSGLDPAEVLRVTGGNPFFVTEVARDADERVPPTARDVVLTRLARLTAESRGVLERASLIGFRVDLPVLLAVVSTPRPIDALDELLTSGLLVEDESGLRFRHEIARMAVAETVPGYRAAPIHATVLDALLTTGTADHARLAFHASAAGDSTRVLEHAPAAGRAAAGLGAHREAAQHYAAAVRAAADADPVLLATLHDALATELFLVDDLEEAAEQREAALATWRARGDHLREGASLRRLSRILWRLCRGADATARAEEAVAALDPMFPGGELTWAIAGLAQQRMLAGRYDEALGLARRARAEAERWRIPGAISDALITEACCLEAQGGEWEDPDRRALALALAHGVHEQAGRSYTNLVPKLIDAHRTAEAAALIDEGLAYCDEHDLATFGNWLLGERAKMLLDEGRHQDTIRLGEGLLARCSSPVNRLIPLLTVATAHVRAGQPGAWPLLDEALDLAVGTLETEWILPTRLARAEARWLEGDVRAARMEVRATLEVPLQPVQRGAVALWLARVGEPDPDGLPDGIEPAVRQELTGAAREASASWLALGRPYDAAMALLSSDDEADLRDAFQCFERLRTPPAARLARERMRGAGIRHLPAGSRSSTLADPRGLTAREQEVLRHLAAGRSNREIAHDLVISAKTVDHHVSAVLSKLGVHSREQAAALVGD